MGAGVLLQKDGRVLLLKRSQRNDQWGGYWNCPGGSSEIGESRYQTALREMREEIGETPPFRVYDHVFTRGYTLFLADVDYFFRPTLNQEHSEWGWFEKSKVLSLPLHPKDRKPITHLLNIKSPLPINPPQPVPPPKT